MKKYIVFLVLGIVCGTAENGSAQLVKKNQVGVQKVQADWYNASYEKDGVYGAAVNQAYEFLKGKTMKKNPVVALIGGGMDVEHEDLKEAIWRNPKEKDNGKDNDKNGYAGDIYGWNFLGGKDGKIMEYTLKEGDREFFRLKDKYADYLFDGKDYYKVIDEKVVKVPAPEDLAEYRYYRYQVLPESELGGSYGGWKLSYVIKEYADRFDRQMKERFPGKELTVRDFELCYDPKAPADSLRDVAFTLMAYAFSMYKTDKWEEVRQNFVLKNIAHSKEVYEEKLAKSGTGYRREIVGDQPLDLQDKHYGNPVLLTSDAVTGVMKSGIIAGKRGNGLGGDGIADGAKIMTLRTQGVSGEPYLKDYALAIRYAVDHGADIIVLSEQNTLYPPQQKAWVSDALAYAEDKGVLVIVPVWELSRDLSKQTFYPNRFMIPGKELTNLMVVAASDKNGNPAMNANYGVQELDLFAPGIEIYSAYPGDTYKTGTGTGLSAATVAGVAALVKAYYPRLTAAQIRRILLENVTSRKDAEVEKGIEINGKTTQDLYLFGELCISGGIVNAYRSLQAADKMTGK